MNVISVVQQINERRFTKWRSESNDTYLYYEILLS